MSETLKTSLALPFTSFHLAVLDLPVANLAMLAHAHHDVALHDHRFLDSRRLRVHFHYHHTVTA